MPVIRLAVWLTALVAIFVPLERLFAAHPQRILRKGIVTDLGYYFLNNLLTSMLLSVPAAMLGWAMHQLMPSEFLATMSGLPFWAPRCSVWWRANSATTGAIAGAMRFHFCGGSIRFTTAPSISTFWSTAARHPVDMVFGRFCGLVPIYVLGLGGPAAEATLVPVVVTLIGTIWGFFIHANLRWRFGPLEWLVSTPGFHHWHHTLNQPINRNFASTLPWIDRLFGTCTCRATIADRIRNLAKLRE